MRTIALCRIVLATAACLVCTSAFAVCPPGQIQLQSGRCFPDVVTAPKPNDGKIPKEKERSWNSGIQTDVLIKEIPAPASSPPDPGGRSLTEATDERQLVPVRAFLRSEDIPPPSIGAYGIVAFRSKPTSANRHRLLMACAAYVAALPRQNSVPSRIALSEQMLTIWPLDNPAAPDAANDKCDFAIDHYDLFGGDSAIADAQKQGAVFGQDGPFLIGWAPSNTRGVPNKLVLVVDMSHYTSQDSFDHAFLFWKQKIVENPELWRSGFSIETIRLAARDFADKYGDTILSATVSIWKK